MRVLYAATGATPNQGVPRSTSGFEMEKGSITTAYVKTPKRPDASPPKMMGSTGKAGAVSPIRLGREWEIRGATTLTGMGGGGAALEQKGAR